MAARAPAAPPSPDTAARTGRRRCCARLSSRRPRIRRTPPPWQGRCPGPRPRSGWLGACRRCTAGAGRRPAPSPAGSRRRRGPRGPVRRGSRPRRPRPGRARRPRGRPPVPACPCVRTSRPAGSRLWLPPRSTGADRGRSPRPPRCPAPAVACTRRAPPTRIRPPGRAAARRATTGCDGPRRARPAGSWPSRHPRFPAPPGSPGTGSPSRRSPDRPVRSPRPRPGSRPRRTRVRRVPEPP